MEENNVVKMAPPWVIYAREVTALFAYDHDVDVDYNDGGKMLTVRVDNPTKCDALAVLLPESVDCGGVELRIVVVPANEARELDDAELYQRAFAGNPVWSDAVHVRGQWDRTYVLFQPEVTQFPSDNMGDLYRNSTMVYQDVARDVFRGAEGVSFCSEWVE